VLRCIELGLPITASETELRRAAQRRAEVGYKDAHTRVRTVRGKASQYACVDCSGAAAEWSYNHTDPDERVQRLRDTRSRAGGWVRELAYSLDPAFYDPRCRPCHIRHDQGRHALPVVG
jgi:hypothetical protein